MVRCFFAGLATAMLVGCSSTSSDPKRESQSNAQPADEQVALQEELDPKAPISEEQPATKHPLAEAARVLAKPTLATPIEAEGGVESIVGPRIDPNFDFKYDRVPAELRLAITSKKYLYGDRTIVVKEQAKHSPLLEYAGTASEAATPQHAGMIHMQIGRVDVLIPWHRAKRITKNDLGKSTVTLVDGGTYTGEMKEVVKDQDGSRYFIGGCDTVTVTAVTRTSAPDKITAPSCQFSLENDLSFRETISFTGRNAHFFSGTTDRPPSFSDCGTNYSLKVGNKIVNGRLEDVQKMTVRVEQTFEEKYGTTIVLRSGETIQGKLVRPPEVEGHWGLVFQTDDECVVIQESLPRF